MEVRRALLCRHVLVLLRLRVHEVAGIFQKPTGQVAASPWSFLERSKLCADVMCGGYVWRYVWLLCGLCVKRYVWLLCLSYV